MLASSSNDLSPLEEALGYKFKKKALLKEAVTHKSFSHEQQGTACAYNERMEFLGDAVLDLIISEHLFSSFNKLTEADLSRMKAYVVQESTLAAVARDLKLGTFLRLGKGEEITGGREKSSLLANAFEAVLAAIYLDGGYKKARDFVLHHLSVKIHKVSDSKVIFDFKTKLQEVAQANYGVLPNYVTYKEEGPEHRKVFEVKVLINNTLMGSGTGRTKKAAAQKAAEEALKNIRESDETEL